MTDDQMIHAPRLRPRIHPRVQSLLENKDLLFNLVERYGSPLNLVFPEILHENIHDFQDSYKKHRLRGRIYFTGKPCKSLALIREAATSDIGLDISSAGSLKIAMDSGWNNERISATGPKNKKYIRDALIHGTLINIDNFDELKQIAALHQNLSLSKKIGITIRIADHASSDSTFGIRIGDTNQILSYLKENRTIFDFLGFSYHSSMASDEQRIMAMQNLLEQTFFAIRNGFSPSQINIGGGFPIMYADSCKEWADYTHALKESVLGKIPVQTWNANGLGFRIENGVLRGSASYINHAPVYTKGEELDRWLSFRLPAMGNVLFADIIRDALLNLSIEPGRGMLDQCGITIGQVNFTKLSAQGETLVGLDMNQSNLHASQFRQLTEPVVIPRHRKNRMDPGTGVYYMGNLCMSNDMLRYNKTYPDTLPQAGDLVAFINTAAYMMDFSESETLMQPIARKIALTGHQDKWHAIPEEDYRR